MNGANIQCVVNKHGFILSIKNTGKLSSFVMGLVYWLVISLNLHCNVYIYICWMYVQIINRQEQLKLEIKKGGLWKRICLVGKQLQCLLYSFYQVELISRISMGESKITNKFIYVLKTKTLLYNRQMYVNMTILLISPKYGNA